MATTRLMTAQDLADLPDDGYQYELVRGELRRMPPPKPIHGFFLAKLIARLVLHLELRLGGDQWGYFLYGDAGFLVERDPDTVRGPDIAFFRADRLGSLDDLQEYSTNPPDLVVEMLSPTNRASEVAEKVEDYRRFGVRLQWVFDPRRRRVTVHSVDTPSRVLGLGDTLDGGDVLPGFELVLAEFFVR